MYAGLARSENVGGSIKLFGVAWGTGAIVASRGRVMENGNLCCPTSLPSLSDAGVHTGSVISKKTSSSSPTAVVPARTFSKAEKKKKARATGVRGRNRQTGPPTKLGGPRA